jgi:hypothetical protein
VVRGHEVGLYAVERRTGEWPDGLERLRQHASAHRALSGRHEIEGNASAALSFRRPLSWTY